MNTLYLEVQKEITSQQIKHAGVKGMKWGVRKKETTEQRTARKEHQAAMNYQKKKQKILETDNAAKILRNKNMFTTEELRTAVNRINVTNQLRSASEQKATTRKKRINNLVNYITMANVGYTSGSNLFDKISDRVKKNKAAKEAKDDTIPKDFVDAVFTESPWNPGKSTPSTALALYEGLR